MTTDQKRPGAPRVSEQGTETRCLTISKEDIAYLLTIDPNLSKAVRILVAKDKHR